MPIPHTAFILGAGLGTRLRPLTDLCPKPILPIAGRPMITYAMDHLIAVGVQRFIINTHHLPEAYTQAFPQNSWRHYPITFVHEPILLDTAGGLKNIEPLLTSQDHDIWLYNGDILATIPLHSLIQAHTSDHTRLITLLLRTQGNPLNVRFSPQTSQILDLRHRLKIQTGIPTLYTGISIVRRSFLSYLTQGKIESLIETLIRLISQNIPIHGHIIDEGTWLDLGTLKDYSQADAAMKAKPHPPH